MASNGYAGKILILHLDSQTAETVDTDKYLDFVGGHGMATALFWDLQGSTSVVIRSSAYRR